jgi:hypothetical protein
MHSAEGTTGKTAGTSWFKGSRKGRLKGESLESFSLNPWGLGRALVSCAD